jgi:hypothetical protein
MKNITDMVRGYQSCGDRKRAIAMLRRLGYNHFVCFKDVNSDYALMYNKASWVEPGSIYVDR